MGILLPPDLRLLCQGMTGRAGTYHTSRMIAYGTNVVAGVTPGKGGSSHLDRPIFNLVDEAVEATGANASMVFVPPANAAAAIMEAAAAELPLIVCITERIPVIDMIRVRQALHQSPSTLVGPNSQGVLVPGDGMVGVMSVVNARRGGVGIVSRSASLTSEIVAQLSSNGLGQSATVGVGGDPVHGIGLAGCLDLFLHDRGTEAIVLIGEIGGTEEEEAAALIADRKPKKPIIALVAGRHAPPERRMGHAGTLSMVGTGQAETKIMALKAAGAIIASNASTVGKTVRDALEA